MRLFISILFLVATFLVQASEIRVAVITSDIDEEIRDFYLITNEKNEVDSIRYVNYLAGGQILEDVTIPAFSVINDGAVIVERNGYDAVRIEVEKDFTIVNGGTLRLNYLYSGVSGARRIHNICLRKLHNAFVLTDSNNQLINDIFVVGNKTRFVGIIGVKEIKTSFKP